MVACTRNATMSVMFLDTRLVCFERRRASREPLLLTFGGRARELATAKREALRATLGRKRASVELASSMRSYAFTY
jgi:hypothetical protein